MRSDVFGVCNACGSNHYVMFPYDMEKRIHTKTAYLILYAMPSHKPRLHTMQTFVM